jgi:hypothetical protein
MTSRQLSKDEKLKPENVNQLRKSLLICWEGILTFKVLGARPATDRDWVVAAVLGFPYA